MEKKWLKKTALLALVVSTWLAPAQAADLKVLTMVLVAESGGSRADDVAIALMGSKAIKSTAMGLTVLDLAVSRNRAAAARYHVVETPLLLCLSSKGVIISRDEKRITKKLMLERIEEAQKRGPELDAKLAVLRDAAERDGGLAARFALGDFLLSQQNEFEAIPVLEEIAHAAANPAADRVRAWVALCKAHLWIAEVEKARHEADDLIRVLGPTTPEAIAGGNLIHGLQDAKAKRTSMARKEFEDAVVASPESKYGQEAKAELRKLK